MTSAIKKKEMMENGSTVADKELSSLLENHPCLHHYQDEIERLLMNSGSFENRKAVLDILIEANLEKLKNHLASLSAIVRILMEKNEDDT